MNNIFKIQPEQCRKPLEYKSIQWYSKYDKAYCESIAFLDPNEIYQRLVNKMDPYQRVQPIGMGDMWINEKGICACGCGKELTGRQTRWASEKCRDWASTIFLIIKGDVRTISYYLRNYYGRSCVSCNRNEHQIFKEDIKHLPVNSHLANIDALAVDHIIPVKNGGGGGWLSNYQYLCHKCHVDKTNDDFGWNRAKKYDTQMKLEL